MKAALLHFFPRCVVSVCLQSPSPPSFSSATPKSEQCLHSLFASSKEGDILRLRMLSAVLKQSAVWFRGQPLIPGGVILDREPEKGRRQLST